MDAKGKNDQTKKKTKKKNPSTKRNKNKKVCKINLKTEKRLMTIIVTFILIELLLIILGILSKKIALYIWLLIIIPIKSLRYFISQFLSFKIGTIEIPFFLILILFISIMLITYYIIINNKKIDEKVKEKITNIIKISEITVLIIEFGIYLGVELMSFNNPNIDTLYFNDQSKNKYTKKDIINYTLKLEDKIRDLSQKFERDKDGKIIIDKKIENIAIEDMKKSSSRYKIFGGIYPTKFFKITEKELKKKSTINGNTSLDMVKLNYNQPLPQLLNSMTHELCHTRGISREDEAVLCSVMVGIESNELISNYGAYLEAYSRAIDALNMMSPDFVTSSEDRMSLLCVENKYDEICNFYNIDTSYYIEKSNEIEIGTYNTSYYDINKLKDLIDELSLYNPTYYLDDDMIPSSEIKDKLIEDKHLIITIKNDEKVFDEVSKILEKYKDKLQYVSQSSETDYKPPELTKEEAEEYYTSEVPEESIKEHLTEKTIKLYDYSRATRLIMEYFDNENL